MVHVSGGGHFTYDGWSEGHFAGPMVQLLCQWPDFIGHCLQRRGGFCVLAAEACVAAAEACKSSWTSLVRCFYVVASLMDVSWQVAAFTNHVASGALTSEFAAERQRLEGRIERLRAQHTDAVRNKSPTENKSRRLAERLAAAEAEKEDLRRRLAEERRDANKACAEAQSAQAEAKLARAEASLARQHAEEMETRLGSLCDRLDKTEASTRAEVERTHTQLVDVYRELSARTTPFEAPSQKVGLRFLGWLQEELEVLPTIVTGLMSFASLITYEGAVNALSCVGCGHFEAFDQSDEGFEREIF
jgi:hypothetical protein